MGRQIDVSVTISPVRDATGHVVGISKVARDITDRRRGRGRARARQGRRRGGEPRARGVQLLRRPRSARASARDERLRAGAPRHYADKLDAEGQDWLHEIVLNAKKMGELIDGLLSLARVTRSELRPERVDLSALVREAAVAAPRARARIARSRSSCRTTSTPTSTLDWRARSSRTCSETPGSSRARRPAAASSSAPPRGTARPPSSCATTAPGSTWPSPTSSSRPSRDFTRRTSFPGPGSASRRCSASCTVTGAASGPKARWTGRDLLLHATTASDPEATP